MFIGDNFCALDISFGASDFGEIAAALQEKYGSATKVATPIFKTRGGLTAE